MRYAIVVNLDYDTNPSEECRQVWRLLHDRMGEAGFRPEGRLFTIEAAAADACARARRVVDSLDGEPLLTGTGAYNYLKEFYGYDHSGAVNLLLPPSDNIELEEG